MAAPTTNLPRSESVTLANPTPPTNVVANYQGTPPTPTGLAPTQAPAPDVGANFWVFADPLNGAVATQWSGTDAKPVTTELAGKAEGDGTEVTTTVGNSVGHSVLGSFTEEPNTDHPSSGASPGVGPPGPVAPTSTQWIELIGSPTQFGTNNSANTGTVSAAVSVPVDTTLALLGLSGFGRADTANFHSTGTVNLTKNATATAMTSTGNEGDGNTSLYQVSTWYMLAPDTGTGKALAWDWPGTSVSDDAQKNWSFTFWKGVHPTTPVRGMHGVQAAAVPAITAALTVQAHDRIAAYASSYCAAANGSGSIDSWQNLTEIAEIPNQNVSEGTWAGGTSSSNVAVGALTSSNVTNVAVSAVVLQPALWPHTSNNNVGTSGALTISSTFNSTSNGQVIQNLDIPGSLVITHSNVTVRNCRITMTGSPIAGIWVQGADCLIESCTVTSSSLAAGVGPKVIWVDSVNNCTIRYCDISGGEDGIYLTGGNHVIFANYIHNLVSTNADPHMDGLQMDTFSTRVEANNIDVGIVNINSSITTGQCHNLLVNNNRVNGGAYTLRFENDHTDSTTVSNNRVGAFVFGQFSYGLGAVQYINNIDDTTEAVLPAGTFPGLDPASIANVTLSGNNLVATNTGTTSANQGAKVVSASSKTTGKWYIETTWTTVTGASTSSMGLGIGTFATGYTNMTGGALGGVAAYQGGTIWTNNTNSGIAFAGAWVAGNTTGVAIDLDNRKIWFRSAPSGNWNNSGTANPATNVGGITIPAGAMVPYVFFGGTGGASGSVMTVNYGQTLCVGAAPSGYQTGWYA